MSDLQFETGYGKPPKNRRFTTGKSGNPKGRPKGSKNFATIFHEVGRQKVKVTDNGVTREITKFEASAMQLLNKASTGDMRALNTMSETNEADKAVMEGIIKRIREIDPQPDAREP